MKKTVALLLVFVLAAFTFCGCGKKLYATEGFDAEKYIKTGDYKNVTVDTKSEEFKEIFNNIVLGEAALYNAYDDVKEGKVEYGDVANIDYVGKKDGVEFSGGSAKGYDLTIGSMTFIPGFEDGLIGVSVGETVDLNLRFPDEYDSAELAGKDVVFTVTVNYKKVAQGYEKFFKTAGFKSADEYKKNITNRAVKQVSVDILIKNSKYTGTPDDETFKSVVFLNYFNDTVSALYQTDIYTYFAAMQVSVDDYIKNVISGYSYKDIKGNEDIYKSYKGTLLFYYIFEKEGLSLDDDGVLDDKEGVERAFEESLAVREKVVELISKNTKLK